MRAVNLVVLVGNVGNDPEIRAVGESNVAQFSLATTYGWGRGDERQEKTEWHRILAWNALADIADQYIRKGDRLYVQGRIQYRSWEDKEGVTRYTTEIVASEIVMLGGRPKAEDAEPQRRPRNDDRRPATAAAGGEEFEDFPGDNEYPTEGHDGLERQTDASPRRATTAKRATARPPAKRPAKRR